MKINYQNELNKEQLDAVENGDGYCLVLSGPGSGKTRVLTFRVAYLLEKGVPSENILLLTFTKKASREMLDRIEFLQESKGSMLGGTFHHVGNYFLRIYCQDIGYSPNYTIIDQEDSKNLIDIILNEINDDNLPSPKILQKIISLAVNSNKSIEEISNKEINKFSYSKIKEIARQYQKRKKDKNLMDYDDLLINWLKILELKKEEISKRFHYVLVDEYQDTNIIQDKILEKLSSLHKNLMVVGDDFQSIYSFRAAEVKNILNFTKKYPAKIFKLETNYRSTPQILQIANCIMESSNIKLNKNLKSVKSDGANPLISCLSSPKEQARFIVQKVKDLNYPETAILFRAHYQAAGLELELAKERIPYVVRGGVKFFEQSHIKDISAFLKVLVNFSDETSWVRILKKQPKIGDKYANMAVEIINSSNQDLIKSKQLVSEKLPSKIALKVSEILDLMVEMKKRKTADGINYLIDSWYSEKLDEFNNPSERLDDLKQLVELSKEYDDLAEMLSDFSLSEDFSSSEPTEFLTLSTIHQAKGLEWENVFLISLKEGQFPHKKSLDEGNLEEERRLFYVAVTRCKENLILTYPVFERGIPAEPSRFLREIENYLTEDSPEIDLIDEDDFNFF